MSWRTVVISSGAKLDYHMGYMVVRGAETTKIFLNEIGTLLIESTAVSLTTALLCELTKKKIKVIFCDEKRNPSSELMPYYGSHDTSEKIRNQIVWDENIKSSVWTEIVCEKIRQQASFLRNLGKEECELLDDYAKNVKFADESNREGHAAKAYFNSLFGKEFTRTSDNAINAALNYGYSIILSSFTREIVANGYITQLGLFHNNIFNQFNLASDFMEPFRILIDRKVFSIMPDEFQQDHKMLLVNVLNEEVQISGRTEYVSNAIKVYTKSIFDALNDKDVSLIKFFNVI